MRIEWYTKKGMVLMASFFLVALLVFVPFFSSNFVVYLITQALIFSIFAVAYDLLFGYTGLVSFGHSVFYGVAAYAVGIVGKTVFTISNPLYMFAIVIITGGTLGIIIGYFCTYTRGIYLALVTFAFAQIFWLLVLSDPMGITFGENGIMGVRPPPFYMGKYEVYLFRDTGLYYLALLILIFCYTTIRRVVNSPLGDVLRGIKQNEERLFSLGYNTRPYKIFSFTLSGVFSAIAGILMVFLNNSITPSMVHWTIGAEVLLMTILGGPGTLIGPILGAFLLTFIEHYASGWMGGGTWLYLLGGLYIIVVMFLRGGIFNNRYLKRLVLSE